MMPLLEKDKGHVRQPVPPSPPPPSKPMVTNVTYSNRWDKLVSKLDRVAQQRCQRAVTEFCADPANPSWRPQVLTRITRRNIISIDAFNVNRTLYKVIFKRTHGGVFMQWVGTHENYNKVINSDSIRDW